jgi:hypothetical protein
MLSLWINIYNNKTVMSNHIANTKKRQSCISAKGYHIDEKIVGIDVKDITIKPRHKKIKTTSKVSESSYMIDAQRQLCATSPYNCKVVIPQNISGWVIHNDMSEIGDIYTISLKIC